MQEAPPGLAYRVFAGGRVILELDRAALVERKAQAIIDYLDFPRGVQAHVMLKQRE